MKTFVEKDYVDMSKAAASMIAEVVKKKPNAVLGLATGSTPIGLYDELVRMENNGEINLSQIRTFNLDEYVGLAESHPESYHSFMQKNLFGRLKNPPKKENIHIPDQTMVDKPEIYDDLIRKTGGIDIQVLGIGGNGHIGFNEPGTSMLSKTHKVTLAQKTREDNKRFFEGNIDKVPTEAITMGLGTIFRAKQCLLLIGSKDASTSKAETALKAIEKFWDKKVPASMLRIHNNTVAILDQAAASKLTGRYSSYFAPALQKQTLGI